MVALLAMNCENRDSLERVTEQITFPSDRYSSLPHLVNGADGRLYLSWVEQSADSAFFRYSEWQSDAWSSPEDIAWGADWFVNWADYPQMTTNFKGEMLAYVLAKSGEDTYAYDVMLTNPDWATSVKLHHDNTQTEHGFATMLPLNDGYFQVAWLDGRETVDGGPMTLRTALVDSEGDAFDQRVLDDRVCDCCQTSGATTDRGYVYVYRDRSENEVRDIAIVRGAGTMATRPQIVYEDNWQIEGCPVNGPEVDAIGNNLAVAWFTAAKDQPKVSVIFSEDGGAIFGDRIVLDDEKPLGRVDLEMLDAESAVVSWLGREKGEVVVKARWANKYGLLGKTVIVAASDEARDSGFPQMEQFGEAMYFAWTSNAEDFSTIRTARIQLSLFSGN